MQPEVYLVVALLILSAIFDAVQDKLQHHFRESIFANLSSWWNPAESWKYKWKNGNTEQGERFLFSSTILVWTTDAWHFFQFLSLSCWQLALAVLYTDGWLNVLLWFGIFKITFSLVFELAFKFGLKKRR